VFPRRDGAIQFIFGTTHQLQILATKSLHCQKEMEGHLDESGRKVTQKGSSSMIKMLCFFSYVGKFSPFSFLL
jgi:hypothetical protein